MTTIVFYITSMPPEAGAAALLSMLDNVVCMGETVPQANERTSVTLGVAVKRVLFIGTYWKNVESTQFVMNTHELPLLREKPQITVYKDDGKKSPIEFAVEYARVNDLATEKFTTNVQGRWARMIQILDARHKDSSRLEETQIVLNGLVHLEKRIGNNATFEAIVDHFSGKSKFEDLVQAGTSIYNFQKEIVDHHVASNSKKFSLKSGHTAIITTGAPKMVNLVHAALHARAPDAVVSIIAQIQFGEKSEISYSIRSYDTSKVSAVGLIRSLPLENPTKGDGNDAAAGGRIPFTLNCDF